MQGDRPSWPARFGWPDLLLAALLFGSTALYVCIQPRNLGPGDESVYLYEAKRVFEGAVLYRDVFEINTPGWLYLMALLFRLFGVDLATARVAAAVLHGLTAVLIYATCRRLAVRRGLSWPPALLYLVLCQSAWPIASQHWLGTFLTALLLLACAGLPGRRARWALWPGVIIGLLIGVHQRGLFVGTGIFVWLLADHVVQRRAEQSTPPVLPRLAYLAAGTALVVVPMFIFLIASAGFEPVWQALVIHPTVNYRSVNHSAWGQIVSGPASSTFPRLLKYLPVILIVDLLRLGVLAARQWGDEMRRLTLLVLFCVASMASIAYFPDYIHIAFIAPAFLVMVAESLERAAGAAVNHSPALKVAGWCAAVLLIFACGLRLQQNLERSRAAIASSRDTAFGRVDFTFPFEVKVYDEMRELMNGASSRELFCYSMASLYLTVDARNPTRYQYLGPRYTSPTQMQEILGVLEERKLPYIVAGFFNEPLKTYLQRDYEPFAEGMIFRRRQG